jgi:3-dehydroquinate synthase
MFEIKIKSSSHTYRVTVNKSIEVNTCIANTFYLVDKRFESSLHFSEKVFFIDAIESCKNLSTVDLVIRKMVESRMNRNSQLVVVGGGLTQDIGTLIASLYMRGIEWTYIPTTFMSMVDSSIGGKSSINVVNYKNIVGNVYPPKEIQIFTDFINTLSPTDVVSGELEAIKICFAKGKDSFEEFIYRLEASRDNPLEIPGLISHIINAKKYFVEEDEFDKGIRQLLNFGHTFGHALETSSNYVIPHGVAIGIGMLAAIDFASRESQEMNVKLSREILGIFSRIRDDLPQIIESVDIDLFQVAFQSDKKHTTENFALILPTIDQLKLQLISRNDESLDRVKKSLHSALEQLRALYDR